MSNDFPERALRSLLRQSDRLSPRIAAAIAFRVFNTPVGARRERLQGRILAQSRAVLADAEALDMRVGKRTVRLYHWKIVADGSRIAPRRRTVLLTHGWTLGARYMTWFVDPLRRAGFDVAAIDFPGHGASSETKAAAPEAVRSIRAAVEVLGGVYAIVGHSFGGSMMVLAVEGAPPLDGALHVDRLVILASGDRLGDILARFATELGLGEETLERLVRKLEKMTKRSIEGTATSRVLPRLGIPTLVVHDPADRVVPFEDAERIASLPRVQLLRADGLGHFRILRSPRVTDAVAAFLSDKP